jgi:hypothetical protein
MPRSRISDVLSEHPVGLRASIFCMDWHSDRTIVVQGQTDAHLRMDFPSFT